MKHLAVVLSFLLFLAISMNVPAVVIGDFEGTSLDGWVPAWDDSPVLANSQTPGTVTLGESSLAVTTTGGYWCLQLNAPTIPASLANTTLKFDLTMIQSEWPSSPWTKVADKVALNSNGSSGWMEFTNATAEWRNGSGAAPLDWGAWASDAAKTFSVDVSSYDITGATWFQIIITLQGGDGTGAFYFDNVQLWQPEAPSPWVRYECEDATLIDTTFINEDEDCSQGKYVSIQKVDNAKNGQIVVTVNAPRAGTYNMRYGQNAFDKERYENIFVNDVLVMEQQFAGNITWTPAEAVVAQNNGWSDEQLIADLFSTVELYGQDDGNWQIWSRWAPAWNEALVNTPMTVDLKEGLNTISIVAVWGWDDWDYIEVELGYIPQNPLPADGGIAIIGTDTELAWDNAVPGLDKVEVWFGQTPEPNILDPNTIITSANYKEKLALLDTIAAPSNHSSVPMPTLENGKRYTWVVDGFSGVEEGGDPNYPGPFWTFSATDNAPPTADAGEDQYVWLAPNSVVVTLDGTGSVDDGKDAPLTYHWTQIAGPAVTLDTPDAAVTTVTMTVLGNTTEAGTAAPYEFRLDVYDGLWTRSDTVTVHVNSNSCTASIEAGSFYYAGDISGEQPGVSDCKVDLYDFVEFAGDWLACSNIFEACN